MVENKYDSNEEYHASDLMGTSTMVAGYNSKTGEINLAKLKTALDGLKNISKSLQKTFDLGTVLHSAVLEQDMSAVRAIPDFEGKPAVTKKAQVEKWFLDNPDEEADSEQKPDFKPIPVITVKSQVEEFKEKNPAEIYLKQSDFNMVQDALMAFAGSSVAAGLVSNALYIEESFYDIANHLKCRPDVVGETDQKELFICNYKSISDLSKCESHIYSLKYDIRAMQEIDIIEEYLNKPVVHYFFLFQEKVAPYSMRLIKISAQDRAIGAAEYKKIRNTVSIAIKEDNFPQPELITEETHINRDPWAQSF